MSIETITLNMERLALPGYTLFNGYITVPISVYSPGKQLNKVKKDRK
jgi:HlyD family secretion protein